MQVCFIVLYINFARVQQNMLPFTSPAVGFLNTVCKNHTVGQLCLSQTLAQAEQQDYRRQISFPFLLKWSGFFIFIFYFIRQICSLYWSEPKALQNNFFVCFFICLFCFSSRKAREQSPAVDVPEMWDIHLGCRRPNEFFISKAERFPQEKTWRVSPGNRQVARVTARRVKCVSGLKEANMAQARSLVSSRGAFWGLHSVSFQSKPGRLLLKAKLALVCVFLLIQQISTV